MRFSWLLIVVFLFALSSCAGRKIEKPKDKGLGVSVEKQVKAVSAPVTPGSDEVKKDESSAQNFVAKKKVVCSGLQDNRIIEVVENESDGCVTLYTKFGETFEKAKAKNEIDICIKVLNKISKNLANAGFNCK